MYMQNTENVIIIPNQLMNVVALKNDVRTEAKVMVINLMKTMILKHQVAFFQSF